MTGNTQGVLIAFCTTISWSIGMFPFTEAARRMGPNALNHIRLVMAGILLTLALVFFFSMPLHSIVDVNSQDCKSFDKRVCCLHHYCSKKKYISKDEEMDLRNKLTELAKMNSGLSNSIL